MVWSGRSDEFPGYNDFPGYFPVTTIFPGYRWPKFPVVMPAVRGVNCPNYLIARRFDGDPDPVLHLDAIFCGNFPVEPGEISHTPDLMISQPDARTGA